jgi:hypothetical protein
VGNRLTQASFGGGELAPSLHSRVDLSKYITGLGKCRNFFVHSHGGVSNRSGTQFIHEIKDSSEPARLIPFSFNTQDSYCLEFTDQCMRVIRNGAIVTEPDVVITGITQANPGVVTATAHGYANGDTVYITDVVGMTEVNGFSFVIANVTANTFEIIDTTSYTTYTSGGVGNKVFELTTPYLQADIRDINFVQSADIITIVHPSHPPADLSRTDHHVWALTTITYAPVITAPTGLTPSGGSGSSFPYVVTTVAEETLEESLPTASVNMLENGGTLSWTAVTGASKYTIYKSKNGVFGFIGQAVGTSFKDEIIIPELDDTPPEARNPFNAVGDYPSTISYYEQRQVYGATNNEPQKLWFSQTGNFHNMSVSQPFKSDDAITVRIDASQVNTIRSLIPLNDMMVMTAGGEFKLGSGESAFSFENMRLRPQGFRGSSRVTPLTIGNTVLFLQNKGSIVRDLSYAFESDSYTGNDLSILSNHLFENKTIIQWAFSQEPYGLIWAVRDDGMLLSMTYQREHEIWAWHTHDTINGTFEDVISIPEGQEDVIYYIVKRTIDGQTKRYIEKLHTRDFDIPEDAFFVDSGLTYDGAAATTITGLEHLEGETVSILADGNVIAPKVVISGQITLPAAASKVHAGLPITADIQTLEPPIENTHSRKKSVARLILKVLDSRGGFAGPHENNLTELKQSAVFYGSPIDLQTGDFEFVISPTWDQNGKVFIRQSDPLPLTILAVIPEIAVGG